MKGSKTTPNTNSVSTIVKHIKIYSDNPMHEAIDRIINSCLCLDEGDDYYGLASLELREAAEDLLVLACQNLTKLQRNREGHINEETSN
jgi:hypothetical protein